MGGPVERRLCSLAARCDARATEGVAGDVSDPTRTRGLLDRPGLFLITAIESGARLVIEVNDVVDDDKECTPEEESLDGEPPDGGGPCGIVGDDSGSHFAVPGHRVQALAL